MQNSQSLCHFDKLHRVVRIKLDQGICPNEIPEANLSIIGIIGMDCKGHAKFCGNVFQNEHGCVPFMGKVFGVSEDHMVTNDKLAKLLNIGKLLMFYSPGLFGPCTSMDTSTTMWVEIRMC
jgi:hypothetical protein